MLHRNWSRKLSKRRAAPRRMWKVVLLKREINSLTIKRKTWKITFLMIFAAGKGTIWRTKCLRNRQWCHVRLRESCSNHWLHNDKRTKFPDYPNWRLKCPSAKKQIEKGKLAIEIPSKSISTMLAQQEHSYSQFHQLNLFVSVKASRQTKMQIDMKLALHKVIAFDKFSPTDSRSAARRWESSTNMVGILFGRDSACWLMERIIKDEFNKWWWWERGNAFEEHQCKPLKPISMALKGICLSETSARMRTFLFGLLLVGLNQPKKRFN